MIGQKSAKCDRRVCRVRVTLENAYLEWKNTAWSTWPAWPCDPCTNVIYVIEAPQVTYVTQSCVSVTHISDVKKNSTWPTWPCDPSTNATDVARVTYVTQFCDPVTHVSDEKKTQCDPVTNVTLWSVYHFDQCHLGHICDPILCPSVWPMFPLKKYNVTTWPTWPCVQEIKFYPKLPKVTNMKSKNS